MQKIQLQLEEDLAAKVEAGAAYERVSIDEYIARALETFAKRRPMTADEQAAIAAEYEVAAASGDTAASAAESTRRAKMLREVEW